MRRLFIAVLLTAAAIHATAEEPARFFIERIEVRGARLVSRDVIVAESRLRESRTYTESDLRKAAARVSRVPYLLSADFALEKGSERGKYILIINVNETKPLFYRLDLLPILTDGPHPTIDVNDVSLAKDNDIAVGMRYFVGRRGEVHAGFELTADNRPNTVDYASLFIGYTRYDIFGTRAFLTLNAKKPWHLADTRTRVEPQIVAGIPLSINQTIAIEYDPTTVTEGTFRRSQKILTARWSYNTTNHPLLPTRGTYLTFAPIAVWHDESGEERHVTRVSNFIIHNRSVGVETSANRWWELPGQNSAGAGLAGGVSFIHETGFSELQHLNGNAAGTTNFGTLSLSIAHSFWSPERVARQGDSRVQLDVKLASRNDRDPFTFLSGRTRQLSLSWIRRTPWGLVRLGAGYAW